MALRKSIPTLVYNFKFSFSGLQATFYDGQGMANFYKRALAWKDGESRLVHIVKTKCCWRIIYYNSILEQNIARNGRTGCTNSGIFLKSTDWLTKENIYLFDKLVCAPKRDVANISCHIEIEWLDPEDLTEFILTTSLPVDISYSGGANLWRSVPG